MTRDDLIQQYGSIRAAARGMGLAETTLRDKLGRGESVQVTLSEKKSVTNLAIRNGSVVVGSDAHYSPGLVTTAHKAFCNVIAEYAGDLKAVILNGDLANEWLECPSGPRYGPPVSRCLLPLPPGASALPLGGASFFLRCTYASIE